MEKNEVDSIIARFEETTSGEYEHYGFVLEIEDMKYMLENGDDKVREAMALVIKHYVCIEKVDDKTEEGGVVVDITGIPDTVQDAIRARYNRMLYNEENKSQRIIELLDSDLELS